MIRSLFIKKKEKVTKKERRKKKGKVERVHSELMKLLLFFFFLFSFLFMFSIFPIRDGGTTILLFSSAARYTHHRAEPRPRDPFRYVTNPSPTGYMQYICVYTACTRWCQERRKVQDGGVPPVCNIHEARRKWLSQKFFLPPNINIRLVWTDIYLEPYVLACLRCKGWIEIDVTKLIKSRQFLNKSLAYSALLWNSIPQLIHSFHRDSRECKACLVLNHIYHCSTQKSRLKRGGQKKSFSTKQNPIAKQLQKKFHSFFWGENDSVIRQIFSISRMPILH
jgi:hypothetical protein